MSFGSSPADRSLGGSPKTVSVNRIGQAADFVRSPKYLKLQAFFDGTALAE
jgi:hypothetical protein